MYRSARWQGTFGIPCICARRNLAASGFAAQTLFGD
jgi:hypothetical protein